MLFGLTNSLAAFKWFMNDILGDLLDKCIMVYLNDILIYSNNLKEHKEHICELLRCLRKHGLYAKANTVAQKTVQMFPDLNIIAL